MPTHSLFGADDRTRYLTYVPALSMLAYCFEGSMCFEKSGFRIGSRISSKGAVQEIVDSIPDIQ